MGRVDFFVALMDAYDEREQLIARLQKAPGAPEGPGKAAAEAFAVRVFRSFSPEG